MMHVKAGINPLWENARIGYATNPTKGGTLMKRRWTFLCSGVTVAIAVFTGAGVFSTGSLADGKDAKFAVVKDYSTFEAQFVGHKISDLEDTSNFFVIDSDGSIAGIWFGKQLLGAWRWDDGFFCRSLSAPRAAPEDCQEWSVADGQARLVRDRGTGEATIYIIRD